MWNFGDNLRTSNKCSSVVMMKYFTKFSKWVDVSNMRDDYTIHTKQSIIVSINEEQMYHDICFIWQQDYIIIWKLKILFWHTWINKCVKQSLIYLNTVAHRLQSLRRLFQSLLYHQTLSPDFITRLQNITWFIRLYHQISEHYIKYETPSIIICWNKYWMNKRLIICYAR